MPGPTDLTIKQRNTLKLYIDPASDTYLNIAHSVMKVYNTSNVKSAYTIGNRLLKRIRELDTKGNDAIRDYTIKNKLSTNNILQGIISIAENARENAVKLKAYELLGKYKELNLWRDYSVSENIVTVDNQDDIDQEFRTLIKTRGYTSADNNLGLSIDNPGP